VPQPNQKTEMSLIVFWRLSVSDLRRGPGRLHSLDPAAAKLRSPSFVLVRGSGGGRVADRAASVLHYTRHCHRPGLSECKTLIANQFTWQFTFMCRQLITTIEHVIIYQVLTSYSSGVLPVRWNSFCGTAAAVLVRCNSLCSNDSYRSEIELELPESSLDLMVLG